MPVPDDVHFVLSIRAMGPVLVAAIVGLVAFSYTECVHQGHCEVFLPSISATWVYPPENYVSRWVVGVLSIFLGLVQYLIFRFDAGGLSPGWNKACFYLGFIGCIGLSWVGAICESTGPTCRGNGTLHVVSAAIFFIGYNVMMAIVTVKKPDPVGYELAMVAASVLAKVRFHGTAITAMEAQVGSFPIGDIIEWADVLLISLWTMAYTYRRGKDIRFGIVNLNSNTEAPPSGLLDFWSMQFTTTISIVWISGALVIPAIFYKVQGRWPQGGIPYISDTWVYPPGNWISRWAAVGGATVAAFTHLCAYYLQKDSGDQGRTVQSGFMTVLVTVALFGASVVGCVDESEDGTIHDIAATTFFVGYDLFMLLVARQLMSSDCIKSVVAWVAGLLSIATKLRFFPAVLPSLMGLWPYIPQALEWADAACVIVFLFTYFGAFGDSKKHIGLGSYSVAPQKLVHTCPEEP